MKLPLKMNAEGPGGNEADMVNAPAGWLMRYRRVVAVSVHVALFAAAHAIAFALRFEFTFPPEYFPLAWSWLAINVAIHVAVFAQAGMFSGLWRYTGAKDLVALTRATVLSTLVFATVIALLGYRSYPRSIFIIEFLLTMILVGGLRFGTRSLWQLAQSAAQGPQGVKLRVLIAGAGNAGEMLLREMQKHGARYEPVGFLDDDVAKQGVAIHGVKVRGRVADAPALAKKLRVDEVVVAIPSAVGRDMRRIVEAVRPAGVPIRTMPGIEALISGEVTLNQLREVAIEDLLGREPVQLDQGSLRALLEGQVVLVTGAGGSIGAELCRQVIRFSPKALVLVERSEPALFDIHRELLAAGNQVQLFPAIADVCDAGRVRALFARHRPQVVIHAAAHKHVPMMEWNPGEAIKNNVGGTRTVADAAHEFEAVQFVMVSTDKAVNPTSIMGATKRVAELYVQARNQNSHTRFVAVRFGNVLGSAGSVIPIFKEQIARGGPVTVTHPDMRRYFMTIPEASQLVLQAAGLGRGGEIFVLDMGEPVKIVDLARDLIRLSGLTPEKDIELRFTGLRPGEKLFEELSTAEERAEKTRHPKIFIGKLPTLPQSEVQELLRALFDGVEGLTNEEAVKRLQRMVPELQRDEQPVVLGSAKSRGILASAGARRAKVVVVAADDLETAAVACQLVREANGACELVVRCPDEDVGAVLAKNYRARAISTSRLAAAFVQGFATRGGCRSAIVIARNNVAARTVEALTERKIACEHLDDAPSVEALVAAGAPRTDLFVLCDDHLGENLLLLDRIRELAPRAKIVCRAFHDEAAELLARPPFDCVVFSSSRTAVTSLVRAGVLAEVGVTDVPVVERPSLAPAR